MCDCRDRSKSNNKYAGILVSYYMFNNVTHSVSVYTRDQNYRFSVPSIEASINSCRRKLSINLVRPESLTIPIMMYDGENSPVKSAVEGSSSSNSSSSSTAGDTRNAKRGHQVVEILLDEDVEHHFVLVLLRAAK